MGSFIALYGIDNSDEARCEDVDPRVEQPRVLESWVLPSSRAVRGLRPPADRPCPPVEDLNRRQSEAEVRYPPQ